jgi:hypothetical protein
VHELRTNPTLRIAAIAFVIFVVVGTVLIFVIPDDESSPGSGLTTEPTLSSANQTSIASYNATTLATTATPSP